MYVTKTFYDVIEVKFWPKIAQNLESDFEKPQIEKFPLPLRLQLFSSCMQCKLTQSQLKVKKMFFLKRFNTNTPVEEERGRGGQKCLHPV